jgi:hypothetical protein
MYDRSAEALPQDEWYALEHSSIARDIDKMCTHIIQLAAQYARTDPEIVQLHKALKAGRIAPRAEVSNIAFLVNKAWERA